MEYAVTHYGVDAFGVALTQQCPNLTEVFWQERFAHMLEHAHAHNLVVPL